MKHQKTAIVTHDQMRELAWSEKVLVYDISTKMGTFRGEKQVLLGQTVTNERLAELSAQFCATRSEQTDHVFSEDSLQLYLLPDDECVEYPSLDADVAMSLFGGK